MKSMVNETAGMIQFGDWSAFKEKLNSVQEDAFESEQTLCEAMGLDSEIYQRIVRFAVNSWKDSPSKSLFHAIGKNGLSLPTNEDVFITLLAQTRYLTMLCEARVISKYALRTVRDDNGEKVKVKGTYALTYPEGSRGEEIQEQVNEVMQLIYVYFLYCKKQEEKAGFKKPKKIYRGVRLSDVFRIPAIEEALSTLSLEDKDFRECRKEKVEALVTYLNENGIQDICENQLVSFTSSKVIAKYFANDNGIILELNSDDVEIMTSEVHDERFAERDYVSNKLEKEYIVRVADEKVTASNVIISDLDYFIATNNPLAVSLFDHDNKSATYELNGVDIKAYYVWTSNTTSAIRYKPIGTNSWGLSSKEFKEQYGFSPVLSGKTINEVKDFSIQV
jgi:hypothetical protein